MLFADLKVKVKDLPVITRGVISTFSTGSHHLHLPFQGPRAKKSGMEIGAGV